MGRQALRLDARRTVAEALDVRQRERIERERRQAGLAVSLITAIGERGAALVAAEQAAGDAVRALLKEKLTVEEISELCAGQVPVKELARLSRVRTASMPDSVKKGGDVTPRWLGAWLGRRSPRFWPAACCGLWSLLGRHPCCWVCWWSARCTQQAATPDPGCGGDSALGGRPGSSGSRFWPRLCRSRRCAQEPAEGVDR